MHFFDFHLHPTLKCLFSKDDAKTSPWQTIDVTAIPWVLRWCSEFEFILGSQSNFEQLVESGCNLVCIALYAPERGMTEDAFLNKQAKGTLSRYLNPEQLTKINQEMTPYGIVKDDLENIMLNPGRFGITDKKIVVLRKGVTYDPDDKSSVYVVFTVEGAHSLSDTFDKQQVNANNIISNIDDLVTNKNIPLLSINLTHLEQFRFCNHAFGILFVSSEAFKPTGNEISDQGIQIIEACYKRGIMIDIKHMSLGSRRHLVERLRMENPVIQQHIQPLICTHAGFTGLSYGDIPDYIEVYTPNTAKGVGYISWGKPLGYAGHVSTAFNPSSINLYNEDIIAILRSGGMIGLSLDKRILGYSDPGRLPDALNGLAFEEEYISLLEEDHFRQNSEMGAKADESYCITGQEVLQGGTVNPNAAYYHLCHFMSHILHLVKVATDDGYDPARALKQVCIGSDFDGLINPVWCCATTLDLNQMKLFFIEQFPYFARANRDKVQLPPSFDIHEFANDLFFENGRSFVMQRIDRMS